LLSIDTAPNCSGPNTTDGHMNMRLLTRDCLEGWAGAMENSHCQGKRDGAGRPIPDQFPPTADLTNDPRASPPAGGEKTGREPTNGATVQALFPSAAIESDGNGAGGSARCRPTCGRFQLRCLSRRTNGGPSTGPGSWASHQNIMRIGSEIAAIIAKYGGLVRDGTRTGTTRASVPSRCCL
jgi:hypothetical protein